MKKLKSIFTDDMDHCIFTGSPYIERHHVFGGANRKRSEQYGFVVPLRYDLHPNGANFVRTEESMKIDQYLKETAQLYYELHIGTRQQFISEFGKSWVSRPDTE